MKNYLYGWELKYLGYIEVPENKYNSYQKDMQLFINALSDVLVKAECGWDDLQYKVMRITCTDSVSEYMVLCVDGDKARWIPITANSKGANLQVLTENIW